MGSMFHATIKMERQVAIVLDSSIISLCVCMLLSQVRQPLGLPSAQALQIVCKGHVVLCNQSAVQRSVSNVK